MNELLGNESMPRDQLFLPMLPWKKLEARFGSKCFVRWSASCFRTRIYLALGLDNFSALVWEDDGEQGFSADGVEYLVAFVASICHSSSVKTGLVELRVWRSLENFSSRCGMHKVV